MHTCCFNHSGGGGYNYDASSIRLLFESTAYQRSLRSQWLNTGRWPQYADLFISAKRPGLETTLLMLLLLSCAKSHMLTASRRQPRLLHVSAVDRRQIWSMDKSWRCVTLSGFLYSQVRCWWNPISCGTHYSSPGLSENDSAVTTDVCEDQNGKSVVGSTTKVELTTVADCQSSLHWLVTSIDCMSLHSGLRDSRRSKQASKHLYLPLSANTQ